jgi:hypothetical protein
MMQTSEKTPTTSFGESELGKGRSPYKERVRSPARLDSLRLGALRYLRIQSRSIFFGLPTTLFE